MKILWFSNTPASGEEFLSSKAVSGGWLRSLDKSLKNKVDLNVAFYYPKMTTSFLYNEIKYFPIGKENWKLKVLKNIFVHEFIDQEDINIYSKIIDEVKPDIIHIHGTENPFGSLINKVDIPIIVSIQGNITIYRQKYFSGIEKNYSLYKNFSNIRNAVFSKSFFNAYKLFEKASKREIKNLKNTKYIIGRTNWDKRITSIFSPQSTYFHNDEMLRDIFYTEMWIPNFSGKIVIHTTNSNCFYKGFETLCQTLSLLNNLDVDIEWRVAGIKNNDSIVQAVKNKLKINYPKKNLLLLGSLNEIELVNKLKEANIYIMTSHIENSPNSLCEAMMLGMPCVSTFAGGSGSIMQDGQEGILIQDGYPWAMAGAILELYKNQSKAMQLGKNARLTALKRHDKEKIVNDLLAIYKTVLNDKDA